MFIAPVSFQKYFQPYEFILCIFQLFQDGEGNKSRREVEDCCEERGDIQIGTRAVDGEGEADHHQPLSSNGEQKSTSECIHVSIHICLPYRDAFICGL